MERNALHSLIRLLRLLERGDLVNDETFREVDDCALDDRDVPDFEVEWLRVHETVKGRLPEMSADTRAMIDATRERAYMNAYSATNDPDLCGYVSDDSDLIAEAIVADFDDPWLNALLLEYVSGRFPHGRLSQVNVPLAEMLQAAGTTDAA
jgi:hypothetical protein